MFYLFFISVFPVFTTLDFCSFKTSPFCGEIVYSRMMSDSDMFRSYAMSSPNRIEPYERYLNTTINYTVNIDTAIIEYFDSMGEVYMVGVEIGGKVFTNSGVEQDIKNKKFVDVSNYHNELADVKEWEEIGDEYFRGQSVMGSSLFEVEIDPLQSYVVPYGLNSALNRVFSDRGIIKYCSRVTKYDVAEWKLISVERKSVSCSQLLKYYNY